MTLLSDPKKSHRIVRILDCLFLTGGVITLFYLLTNGIPLIQGGWLHELGKKSHYTKVTRLVLIGYAIPLFLYYSLARSNFKKLKVVELIRGLAKSRPEISAMPLALSFWITFVIIAFARTRAFETRAFDLGIFAQAVWNTLQGHFMYSSLKGGICLFGDHFSPILLLTVPFYRLWPDPRTLLSLQALATSINIILIFKIAHQKTKDRGIALLFAVLYAFFRATRGPLREDFHPEVLAEPFMLGAFLCLEQNHVIGFLMATALMVLGKENILGISFILGFYCAIFKKRPWTGIGVAIFSVLLFLAEIHWWIPAMTGKPYFYQAFYSGSGNPWRWIGRLLTRDSLRYVLTVFGPLSFLSFFHFSTFLLTFPILFQNLLSRGDTFRSLSYHYAAGLTPFVLVSSIYGFDSWRSKSAFVAKHAPCLLGIVAVVFFLQAGPSEYYYLWHIQRHFSHRKDVLHQELAKIPPEFSVLTHNGVIPHVVNRKNVYQFNYNPVPGKVQQAAGLKADYVILGGEFWEPNTEPLAQTRQALIESGYRIQYQDGDFSILKSKEARTVAAAP